MKTAINSGTHEYDLISRRLRQLGDMAKATSIDLNGKSKSAIDDAQLFLEYLVGNNTLIPTQELAVEDIVNGNDSAIKQLRVF